jgi:hypothetical protein
VTPEQEKALALARARRRREEAAGQAAPQGGGWTDTLKDVGASAASGIARGAADIVGLPGTLSNLFDQGVSYVTGMQAPPPNPFNAENARAGLSALTGGATSYKPETTAGEYASTVGEFLPGAALFGGVNPSNLLINGVAPAVTSEAAGQLTEGSAIEPYARVAAALVTPSVVSKAITPIGVSAERQAAANSLRGEGVQPTAGQITGSRNLRAMEGELGGGAAANVMERQGEQFTSAVLSRAGINANRASPEVIDGAFTRIGNEFDTLATRNQIVPDPQFGQDLGDTFRQYVSVTPESARSPIVEDLVSDLTTQAASGPISGDFFQRTTSRLAKMIRSTTDIDRREALQGIRDALDDAMERSIAQTNPNDLGGWQGARNQYRNMLVIEKAATAAGENAANGLISPSSLRNAVVQQSRRAYARGQGDFAELARSGEAVLKPLPDSGTATRLNARTLGGLTGAGGGIVGTAAGGPMAGIAGALAGAAVPAIAGTGLMSRPVQRYLANALLERTPLSSPERYAAVIAALLGQNQQPQLPSR